MTIDLNCDMGEAYGIYKCGDDAGIMPLISVANVACGFHASDPSVMRQTVRLAKQHGVRVGAHPSYPDRDGFGRRRMEMEGEELTACIIYQVGALKGFLDAEGVALNHVKPHGALYGAAWHDETVARAIARAAKAFDAPLMAMSGTGQGVWYQDEGVDVIWETYVDLAYTDDGEIVITRQHDPVTAETAAAQALRSARDGQVQAMSGKLIDVKCETICVHSDTPGAVEIARAVKDAIAEYA
ncbi:MAG: 5-oxoprolinase subunit PxpA [Alphaproteobacteria bacterium]